MRKYECTTYLIEDTVEEALKFNSLMDAARYLYDSDMSPNKPTVVSIYTALVYAVKHNNRYKNYTIRLERNDASTFEFNHLKNILGFLSEEGVNNFNRCFVDDDTPYNFNEAKQLYDEHLFNLLAEMGVDSDLDAVAELSSRLTDKFYYHPNSMYRAVKSIHEEIYTTYVHDEDITVIWQNVYYCGDLLQKSLIGFYYGQPDERNTKDFSDMPHTAQFFW
jgi:hypothetical protein